MCSIHADPDIEYPYTCGFADQIGGIGAENATFCLPLPGSTTWANAYENALVSVIDRVIGFGAQAMVVSLGVDTLDKDPVAVVGAGFSLQLDDYLKIGKELRRAEVPTIFVQEGGYDMARLGVAVANVMKGFCEPQG